MNTYYAGLDFAGALSAPAHCPSCGSDRLLAVMDAETQNFRCAQCRRCWRMAFDMVVRVDPRDCVSCQFQSECLAVMSTDVAMATEQ